MARRLNLTAARIARWEAMADPPVLEIGAHEFRLPPEVNLLALEPFKNGDFAEAGRLLFGAECWAAVCAEGFYVEDLNAVLRDLYGLDLGESLASSPTSTAIGPS